MRGLRVEPRRQPGSRTVRERMMPSALAVSLSVHAAVAAALLWHWGGEAPRPLPMVVVELVDGPPGQRNAVLDQAARNSGIAAQRDPGPEPPSQSPAQPPNRQPADPPPPDTAPADKPPPPDAQRPPEVQPAREPVPHLQATLPVPPVPLKRTASVRPPTPSSARPDVKATPANAQVAARPNDAANASTATATGELVPPRFGLGAGQNPMPEYPDYARRRGWEGRVVLSVEVDETGRGRSVAVKQSSGHKLLDDAALAAVRGWRFVPGMRGNTPIAAQVDVPIRFRLEDVR